MAIIYTYPTKASPTSSDLILISDASDSNATKSATIGTALTGAAIAAGTAISSTAGTAGQMLFDSGFLYICTVTGTSGNATWKKVALSAL
jgi:hypothetical protein